MDFRLVFMMQRCLSHRKFDETTAEAIGLHELPIAFPPSYAYSEVISEPKKFLSKR